MNPTGYEQVLERRDGSGALVRGFVLGRDVISQTDGSAVRHLRRIDPIAGQWPAFWSGDLEELEEFD